MEMEWESEEDRQLVVELAKRDRVTARRMDRIKAAKDYRDLEPPANGRAHFLNRDYAGCFALDLKRKTDPERLICVPIGDYQMIQHSNQYKKDTIKAFKVVKIEGNYHK